MTLQRLGVRILKCVGYDEAFQREIHDEFPNWVPPPPRPKGEKGKKVKAKTGQKRKRNEVEEGSDEEIEIDDEAEIMAVHATRTTKRRQKRHS